VAKARISGMILVVALVSLSTSAAKAQVVGRCIAETQYSTIQAAVNAAQSGSVIKVCPGDYSEQVVIEKPLTLEGITSQGVEGVLIVHPANGLVVNDSTWAAQLLVKNTSGVMISNLIVDAAGNPPACTSPAVIGIVFHNASGTVNNVVSGNAITETCAGILTTGTGSNELSGNAFNALYVSTLNATTCGPIF